MRQPCGTKRRALVVALCLSALSAAPARAQATYLPGECVPDDECLCLKGEDVDKLNSFVLDCDQDRARLEAAVMTLEDAKAVAATPNESFWRQPEVVVGGVVVSFALGGLIGWALAR